MKYRYSGPPSGVTLQDGEETREVMLHTGTEVDLPEGSEYTKTLLALGYLTPTGVQPKQSRMSARYSAGADEPATKGA